MNFIPQVKRVLSGLGGLLACQLGLMMGPVFAQVPNYVPQTNLLAWYPFSGNANDFHTTGRNLRIYNSASLTSDRFGVSNRAYSFRPATADFMEASFPTAYNAYTIAAWVQVDSFFQFPAISTRGVPAGSNFFVGQVACFGSCSNKATGIGIGLNDSTLRVKAIHYDSSSAKQEQFSSNPGKQWFHIAAVWNGRKRFLYINGIVVDSVSMGSVKRLETSFMIGAGFYNQVYYFHSGKIDDVGIWNRALNSCEVYGLYKAALPVPVVSIGNNVQQFCGSDSAQLTATAGFVSYRWNTSANTRSIKAGRSGWFHVTATDSFGCRARDTALVSILNPRILSRDTLICQAPSFTVRVKTPATLACPEAPPQFASSLLAWYPFCGNTRDAGTRGHHGTNFGASLSNDRFGRSNNAYSFNGTGDYISIGDPSDNSFDLLGKPFTISLWVKTKQTNLGPLVTKQRNNFLNQSGDYNFDLEASTGKARMAMGFGGSGASKVSSTAINNDVWRHLVAVYTKDSIEIYVDGIKNTSGSNAISGPGSLSNSISSLLFGRGWLNAFFQGQMDDIGLFNRVLTPAEVKFLYQGPVYSWSTADTGTTAVVSGSGRMRVWVKAEDGISSCSDTTFITFSSPKVRLASDTIRLTACSRDSMRLGVGTGWKSVLWSNASTDSAAWFKTTGRIHVRTEDSFGCFAHDTAWFINPGKPKALISSSDSVNCNGGSDGSLSSSGSGGFLPHTYRWNDPSAQTSATANGLAAGAYRLILRDAFGCADTLQGTVHQPTAVRVSISSTDSVNCKAGNDGSASATASGGSGGYKYRWNDPSAQTTATATGLRAGTYRLNVRDVKGCADSLNIPLYEPDLMYLTLAMNDSVDCFGGSDGALSALASGGTKPYRYTWNDPSRQTSSTAFGLKAGKYFVRVTDYNGCKDSMEIDIKEPDRVRISLMRVDSVRCFGGSDGSITAIASGGNGLYRYLWNDPAKQTTSTATGLPKGNWKVWAHDQYNCSDSAVFRMDELARLRISITAVDSVRCFGGTDGRIQAAGTGGTLPYSYRWNDPAAQRSQTAVNLARGRYSVRLTDAKGCTDTISRFVAEPTRLLAQISFTDSVRCFSGSDGRAMAQATGGNGGYQYLWNDQFRQTTALASNLFPGVYRVRVTDRKGCRDSVTATVHAPLPMILSIVSDSVNCFGGSDGSLQVKVQQGRGPLSFSWTDPARQSGIRASNLRRGNYRVRVTDIRGCRDSMNGTVHEPARLLAFIVRSDSVNCSGGADGALEAGGSGGSGGYRWQWNDPAAQRTSIAGNLQPGSYIATLRDVYGCSDTAMGSVFQPTPVRISLTGIDSVRCFGGSDGRIHTTASGGSGGYRWRWNDPFGQLASTAINLRRGTYKAVVRDIYGCSDSLQASVAEPERLDVAITRVDQIACFGGSDGALYSAASGGVAPITWLWNDPAAQRTPDAFGLRQGRYLVTVRDSKGCTDTASALVREPVPLRIRITQTFPASCYRLSDAAANTVTSGGTTPYSWNWNSNPPQFTANASNLPAGKYRVVVRDFRGCSDSTEVTFDEPDPITVQINGNRLTMYGMVHDLEATVLPVGRYTCNWTPQSVFGPGNGNSERPRGIFTESGTVKVIARNTKGCEGEDTAYFTVVLLPEDIMPTAFTPNIDNLNEGFGMPSIFDVEEFTVYDRWGAVVFRASPNQQRWDGRTASGVQVPSGSYTYRLRARLKGTQQYVTHTGKVSLIR